MQVQNPAFHRQQNGDKDCDEMIELAQPDLEGTEMEFANIQRWEDDGGQVIDCVRSMDRSNSYPTRDSEIVQRNARQLKQGEAMGRKSVSKRKPKKKRPFSKADIGGSSNKQTGERTFAQFPLKEIVRPLNRGGAKPSAGPNKSPRKR